MSHQSKKGFQSIFVGVSQNYKGYLIYVPSIQKIVYSYNVVFEIFSIELEYTSRTELEALATQPAVMYIPYTTSSHGKTGEIITFLQFEEGDLLKNECNL